MSWIKEVFDGFATLCGKPPEVQLLKYKQKLCEKEHKEYLQKQFNECFALMDIDELKFLMLLMQNNNQPQKVSHTWDFHYDWKVEINKNDEYIYQIIKEADPPYCDYSIYNLDDYNCIVRINPIVWDTFTKEFKKYAKPRLIGVDVDNLNFEHEDPFEAEEY